MPHVDRWRDWATIGRFAALHLSVLSVLLVPFHWSLMGWLAGSYLLRMFGVTAGYHRYFSHRSYKLGRVAQFAMAVLAQTSAQKGVLWWAAHHRDHHRHSDREADVHSPRRKASGGRTSAGFCRPSTKSTSRAVLPISAGIRSCAGWIGITGCRPSALASWSTPPADYPAFAWGYLAGDGAPLPRDVCHQLGRAHLGHAPIRDRATTAATTGGWRWSRSGRAGTTTITTARRAAARGSGGGNSTPPMSGCVRSKRPALPGISGRSSNARPGRRHEARRGDRRGDLRSGRGVSDQPASSRDALRAGRASGRAHAHHHGG